LSDVSTIALAVSGLGKKYRLNAAAQPGYSRLSESLLNWARQPLKALKRGTAAKEDFWALQNVSFEVKQGEVVGVIGRNGAGKSTLLKILSRITEPTTGRIVLRGRVASLLEVGTGFHPELSGRENIFLNGAILGMQRREIQAKFDEIVAFAEVERFLNTSVKHYSSGMQMRLAFAVAAHLNPDVLIVDEVLAVGDAAFQQKCFRKIDSAVAAAGVTVIFVSHNMDSVLRLANRALVLEAGAVTFAGTPKACVEHYSGQVALKGADVDLTAGSRPSHVRGGAMMMQARSSNTEVSGWNFPFGQDIAFEVTVRVTTGLRSVNLGVGIFAAAGTEVASALSSHSLPELALEPGDYRFSIRFPGLRLVPGLYSVGVGVQSERGQEDYLSQAWQFFVTSSPVSASMQTDGFRGFVVPLSHCTITPLSACA
jgi:lipopolysaccharide transport system ATP-binding protein